MVNNQDRHVDENVGDILHPQLLVYALQLVIKKILTQIHKA